MKFWPVGAGTLQYVIWFLSIEMATWQLDKVYEIVKK